ncbi:ATP-grasp domain-containing protein [Pseudoalteromonas luteoviolacea]|uniref:ATP-grasp domain-containing protein n=1 Tax=Pseudoalteromonas luteoviolacea TaxID=43657 RepID=UPI001B3586F1|nr:ATP-grasp domain-containing protein [Pseudoalteromonas luteoviolacea]MBQ4838270.1 ATP-grasp domain-containing protein [Pseudoalteromonas luteoviolacea]
MNKTVLFPNAGRRVELIKRFRAAAEKSDIQLTIIGTDITTDAPALQFCDATYIFPRERNEATVEKFIDLIAKHNIDIVVCTIDPDLEFFSKYRDQLSNVNGRKVNLLLSDVSVLNASSDKRKTARFFESINVRTPEILNKPTTFPVFAKPNNGSGSFGAKLLKDESELETYLKEFGEHDPIFQQFISGTEYTIDCFVTDDGDAVASPRERVKVRGGEVTVSKTVALPELEKQAKEVLLSGGFYGPVTLQAIVDEKLGVGYFIEINARFGGGSILSIEAGLNSPNYILSGSPDWFEGLRRNLTMMRYDMSVFSEG